MTHEDALMDLFEIVQLSFQNAMRKPDAARWKSCAQLAGVASTRMGFEGDLFRAAALEGVSVEARRQMLAMIAMEETSCSH